MAEPGPFGSVINRIFGPPIGVQTQMYEDQRQTADRERLGGIRSRVAQELVRLKEANPNAPPNQLVMQFLSSPTGIDAFAADSGIGEFIGTTLGQMQAAPPTRTEVSAGGKSVATDPFTQQPLPGTEITNLPAEAQTDAFTLTLNPEQRQDLVNFNTALKAADSTQAERAAARLEQMGYPRHVLDLQLSGSITAVDVINPDNGDPAGQKLVNNLTGQTVGTIDAQGNATFGNGAAAPGGVPFRAPGLGAGAAAAGAAALSEGAPGVPGGVPAGPGGDPMSAMRNLIGGAEGTDRGRGYNETLDYGRYTGGPVDLTRMTLDQVDQLQTRMLRHPDNPHNSSAAGRYQIVQQTLRGLRRQLGLTGQELYDERLQDTLANALLQARGSDPAGLRQEWVGLNRVDDATIHAALSGTDPGVVASQGTPQRAGTPVARQPPVPVRSGQQAFAERGGPSGRNVAPTGGAALVAPGAGYTPPSTASATNLMSGTEAMFAAGPVPSAANWVSRTFGAFDPGAVDAKNVEARTALDALRETALQWEKSISGDTRDSKHLDDRLTRMFDPTQFLTNPRYGLTQLKAYRDRIEDQYASDQAIAKDQSQFKDTRKDARERMNGSGRLLKMIGTPEELSRALTTAEKLQDSGKLKSITDQFQRVSGSINNALGTGLDTTPDAVRQKVQSGADVTLEELLLLPEAELQSELDRLSKGQ